MIIIAGIIAFYLSSMRFREMFYVGIGLHTAYVFSRGITAGRLPVVGLYDTLIFLSLSVVIFSLPLSRFIPQRGHFLRASAVTSVFFLIPPIFLSPHNNPLPPVLKTFWFEVHVVLSFFSYALFIIGGITGIFYFIFKERGVERIQYRAILIGYTLFSIAMISGGIWAFYAWGTYWLWTPKEIWTSVLWLYYSIYLHTRLQKKLSGEPASLIGIIGVFVMLFTYLGVGLLMKSSHSF